MIGCCVVCVSQYISQSVGVIQCFIVDLMLNRWVDVHSFKIPFHEQHLFYIEVYIMENVLAQIPKNGFLKTQWEPCVLSPRVKCYDI